MAPSRGTSPWVTGSGRLLLLLPASIVLAWSVWTTSQLMPLRADVAELIDAVNATQQQVTEYRVAFIDGMDAPRMGHGLYCSGVMPNPYDVALQERAVKAYESGEGPYTQVAGLFRVDRRTLERWVARWRPAGSVAPHPRGGLSGLERRPCRVAAGADVTDRAMIDRGRSRGQ
jgi:helix-turn-helix protein